MIKPSCAKLCFHRDNVYGASVILNVAYFQVNVYIRTQYSTDSFRIQVLELVIYALWETTSLSHVKT